MSDCPPICPVCQRAILSHTRLALRSGFCSTGCARKARRRRAEGRPITDRPPPPGALPRYVILATPSGEPTSLSRARADRERTLADA